MNQSEDIEITETAEYRHGPTRPSEFQWPGGIRITYDVKAPKDKWVIISAGGQAVDRIHDRWPLVDGDM